jgi:cytoskeletal protein RodZ
MNETLDQFPTVGSLLRQNREDLGLTLRDLAAVTRIQSHMLQCLEEDRFDEFPAEVFCRGFLRSYARELRMDDEALVDAYLQQRGMARNAVAVAGDSAVPASTSPAWTFLETGKLGRVAYVGAIAAVVIGLVLSMLVISSPSSSTPTANLSANPVPQSPWSNSQAPPSDWRAYERN